MTYSFIGSLEKFNSDLWWYHIKVPEEISSALLEDKSRRVRCTLNDQIEYPCALMPSGGIWFVNVNKQVRSKLGLVLQQEIKVDLVKDHSEYGMDVPEELEVLLEQDEEGKQYFEKLTKGKQRSLIYIVSKVKNTNSRLNKALAIVHHLKESQGKLDFKGLQMTIKEYNQRSKLK